MNCIRKHIISFAMLLMCATSSAQMKWNQSYQTYINQYKDSRHRADASLPAYQQVSLLPRDSLRAELDRANSQDKATTTLASNAITGQVLPNTTMTMHAANASEYIRMPKRVMKTTAVFWPSYLVIHAFSVSTARLQRMGSWT